jgi:hypothetical protein
MDIKPAWLNKVDSRGDAPDFRCRPLAPVAAWARNSGRPHHYHHHHHHHQTFIRRQPYVVQISRYLKRPETPAGCVIGFIPPSAMT